MRVIRLIADLTRSEPPRVPNCCCSLRHASGVAAKRAKTQRQNSHGRQTRLRALGNRWRAVARAGIHDCHHRFISARICDPGDAAWQTSEACIQHRNHRTAVGISCIPTKALRGQRLSNVGSSSAHAVDSEIERSLTVGIAVMTVTGKCRALSPDPRRTLARGPGQSVLHRTGRTPLDRSSHYPM
jgi:hypothetical protein